MVKAGEYAPDFELKNYKGETFKLSNYRGKKPVVVFFYPADGTPGCTTQACEFQRRSPDFKAAGVEVFGISSNGDKDKESFVKAYRLNDIQLLIDEGSQVRKLWQVPNAILG